MGRQTGRGLRLAAGGSSDQMMPNTRMVVPAIKGLEQSNPIGGPGQFRSVTQDRTEPNAAQPVIAGARVTLRRRHIVTTGWFRNMHEGEDG
jgi:hypothetical protein